MASTLVAHSSGFKCKYPLGYTLNCLSASQVNGKAPLWHAVASEEGHRCFYLLSEREWRVGGGGGGDGERGEGGEGDRDRKMWRRDSAFLSLRTRPALLSASVSVAVALARAICPTSGYPSDLPVPSPLPPSLSPSPNPALPTPPPRDRERERERERLLGTVLHILHNVRERCRGFCWYYI